MASGGIPATLAALRKELAELRKLHVEDSALIGEALAGILAKLDELLELVTKRTAPP